MARSKQKRKKETKRQAAERKITDLIKGLTINYVFEVEDGQEIEFGDVMYGHVCKKKQQLINKSGGKDAWVGLMNFANFGRSLLWQIDVTAKFVYPNGLIHNESRRSRCCCPQVAAR